MDGPCTHLWRFFIKAFLKVQTENGGTCEVKSLWIGKKIRLNSNNKSVLFRGQPILGCLSTPPKTAEATSQSNAGGPLHTEAACRPGSGLAFRRVDNRSGEKVVPFIVQTEPNGCGYTN
jgi:hypothetical protein